MKTNPKINESHALKKKALNLLSKAIAKIIIKFRLPRNEFLNLFDEKLVLEAQRLDPDASHVALAIRTGIDRRYISKHLKGEMPRTKPDKLTIILEDVHWVSHKYYNSNTIPKKGPFRTFQSICEQRAPGSLTYQAILVELVRNGNVKDHGNFIELIKLKNITKSESEYSQLTVTQINRLVNTLLYNSDKLDYKDKYVQRTIYSTQINPKNFDTLHNELKLKTELFRDEVNELMIRYEEEINIGTYPEYGYSFLEYKIEKTL
jgi:hypothetical protein